MRGTSGERRRRKHRSVQFTLPVGSLKSAPTAGAQPAGWRPFRNTFVMMRRGRAPDGGHNTEKSAHQWMRVLPPSRASVTCPPYSSNQPTIRMEVQYGITQERGPARRRRNDLDREGAAACPVRGLGVLSQWDIVIHLASDAVEGDAARALLEDPDGAYGGLPRGGGSRSGRDSAQ